MLIYYSTKSKVKPQLKSKAERDQYAEWCKKHGIKPSGKQNHVLTGKDKSPVEVTKPYRRETINYPSRDSGTKGAVTTSTSKNVYTGDALLGIATMHKSNLVPVFKEADAVELSHMRR